MLIVCYKEHTAWDIFSVHKSKIHNERLGHTNTFLLMYFSPWDSRLLAFFVVIVVVVGLIM